MILHYIIHSKSWSYVINVKTVTGGSCGCSINVVVQKSRDPHKPKMNHEDKRQSNNKKGKSKVQISENSRRKKQTHTKARHEETLVGDTGWHHGEKPNTNWPRHTNDGIRYRWGGKGMDKHWKEELKSSILFQNKTGITEQKKLGS